MTAVPDPVDLDALTERLSLQDWRSARPLMYQALRELRQAREALTTATAEQVEWLKGLREAAGEPPVDVWLLYSIQQRMESLDELRASAIGNQP